MIVYKRFSQAILIEASGLVQIHWLNLLQTATTQEYLTGPLDKKPARQAGIELAGKVKH